MSAPATVAETRPLDSSIEVASTQRAPFAFALRVRMTLWTFVQSTFFRWSPTICRGFRRWLLRLFGARLAPTASIHNKARIDCPWNLEMGDRASLGEDVWVYALDQVVVGEYAC